MKRKIGILSFIAILVALLTLSVSAITISEFSSDSTFKPVSYSTHKSISSVTLYGNADYLCMKAYSEKNNSELFCLDIYSDSKYKKTVSTYSTTFKVGTKYENILFDLTGFESGTYYAMAYVKKKPSLSYYETQLKKDPETEVKFKIVINRKGSSDIKNAKVVMYSYENTENGPTVYWYNLPKAKGYYIYRKDGDTYKKIATVKTNKGDFGKYTDKSYKGKNATKYYKIKAYSGSTVSGYSKNNVKAVIVKTPTVKVQAVYGDRIKVTWGSIGVKNAEYTVYRAKGKNGEWQKVAWTYDRCYYDSRSSGDLKNNTAYYYTVIATTSTAISGYDTDGVGIRFFYTPTLESATATKEGVTVTWKKISGAESYEIYRRANKNDDWSKVGTSKTLSYTDNTAEANTAYYYTVKAKKGNSIGSYNNSGLRGGYFPAPTVNDITDLENGYPVITWSAVANCDKYVVYRKAVDGTKWEKVTSTKELRYTDTDTNLESGKKYYYTVKGACTVSGSNSVYSDMDDVGKSVTYYGMLQNLAPAVSEKGIGLVWDKAAGVEKYNIYRKTEGHEFKLIGTAAEPNYTDLTAEKDIIYIYKVTYFVGDKEMTTYGDETKAQIKDNNIELSDEGCFTVTNWNYYTVKIKDADPFATYSFYLKTDEGMKLYLQKKTSDGSFSVMHVPDVAEAEFIVTAVMEDGTVYGFDGAESFKLYYPEIQSPTTKSNQTEGSVEISWPDIEGADKYYVYKYDKLIATVENSTSYLDTDIEEGKLCNYYIAIVIDYCVIKVNYQVSGCIMKVPEVKAEVKENYVSITWDVNYVYDEVLRRKEGETTWTKLGRVSNELFHDDTAEDSQVYYYTVRPHDERYGYGRYDETGVKICYMKPVELSKLKVSGSKIVVEWPEKKAAESYKLYRKAQGDSKWTLIKTYDKDDNLRYEDTDINSGVKYNYGVVAISETSKSVRVAQSVLYLAPVKLISAKAGTKGITVKFENLGKTDSYVVYRKTKSTDWKKVATLSSTASSYTDTSVKSGTKYTYTVAQIRSSYVGPCDTKGVSATAK